ncbi:MAG TPA: hypothetical protein VMK13_12635 [Streptosporangiaceae bacterium]|nr:hypothetical protein [Streptosporangiaceae bacterium]
MSRRGAGPRPERELPWWARYGMHVRDGAAWAGQQAREAGARAREAASAGLRAAREKGADLARRITGLQRAAGLDEKLVARSARSVLDRQMQRPSDREWQAGYASAIARLAPAAARPQAGQPGPGKAGTRPETGTDRPAAGTAGPAPHPEARPGGTAAGTGTDAARRPGTGADRGGGDPGAEAEARRDAARLAGRDAGAGDWQDRQAAAPAAGRDMDLEAGL